MKKVHPKKLCAWCEKESGWKETKSIEAMGYNVSHGICEKHAKIEEDKLK